MSYQRSRGAVRKALTAFLTTFSLPSGSSIRVVFDSPVGLQGLTPTSFRPMSSLNSRAAIAGTALSWSQFNDTTIDILWSGSTAGTLGVAFTGRDPGFVGGAGGSWGIL